MRMGFGLLVSGVALIAVAVGSGARAQDMRAAERMLRETYAADLAEPSRLVDSKVYSPGLLALIRKDTAAAGGEVGNLDFDPFCDCQDADGLKLETIMATPTPAGADGAVTFSLHDRRETLHFMLIRVRGAWRIDEIRGGEYKSLRAVLAGSHS